MYIVHIYKFSNLTELIKFTCYTFIEVQKKTPKKITEWKIKSFQLIFVSQFPTSYKISNFPIKKKMFLL